MVEPLNYTQGPVGHRFNTSHYRERGSRSHLGPLLCVCIVWTEDISWTKHLEMEKCLGYLTSLYPVIQTRRHTSNYPWK